MFILSKGNCYGLIVDGTQKRTSIKVCWMFLFPRGKHSKIKIKNDRERKFKKCFKGINVQQGKLEQFNLNRCVT